MAGKPKRKSYRPPNPNTRRQLEQLDEGTGQTYMPPKEPRKKRPTKKRAPHDGAMVY